MIRNAHRPSEICGLVSGVRRGGSGEGSRGGRAPMLHRPGFTRPPENSKRAHLRVPIFKNTKIPREEPRERKNEHCGGRGEKRAKVWAVRRRGGGPGEGLGRGLRNFVRRLRKWVLKGFQGVWREVGSGGVCPNRSRTCSGPVWLSSFRREGERGFELFFCSSLGPFSSDQH